MNLWENNHRIQQLMKMLLAYRLPLALISWVEKHSRIHKQFSPVICSFILKNPSLIIMTHIQEGHYWILEPQCHLVATLTYLIALMEIITIQTVLTNTPHPDTYQILSKLTKNMYQMMLFNHIQVSVVSI
jgi:hypothetical protein